MRCARPSDRQAENTARAFSFTASQEDRKFAVVRTKASAAIGRRREGAAQMAGLSGTRTLSPPAALGCRGGQHSGKFRPPLSAGGEAVRTRGWQHGLLRLARTYRPDTAERSPWALPHDPPAETLPRALEREDLHRAARDPGRCPPSVENPRSLLCHYRSDLSPRSPTRLSRDPSARPHAPRLKAQGNR